MATRLPVPPELTNGPLTRRQAADAGLSADVLKGSRFVRVRRGVYQLADLPTGFRTQLDAALAVLPDAAIASHDTAARLLGLPLPGRLADGPLHFWVPAEFSGSCPAGIVLHRYLERPATSRVAGVVVSTAGKTFIDMATRLAVPDLVALGDGVVRRCGALPIELQRLAREPRRRWIRKARQAARLVRAGVDSAPESHLRLAFLDGHLPEPDVNVDVTDADGGWIARPDLSWRRWKVAVEYDGAHHLTDRKQWNRDIGRRELLERDGWIVIVVNADRLYRHRDVMVARVREALVSRGAPIF